MAEETTENFVSTINVRELISIFENKKTENLDYSYSRPRAKSWGNVLDDNVVVRYNDYYTLEDIKKALDKVETSLNFYQVYDKQKHVAFQEQLFNILTSVVNIETDTEDGPAQKKRLITKTQTLVSYLNQKLPNVRSPLKEIYTKRIEAKSDNENDVYESSDVAYNSDTSSEPVIDADYTVSVKKLKQRFQSKDETDSVFFNTPKLRTQTSKEVKPVENEQTPEPLLTNGNYFNGDLSEINGHDTENIEEVNNEEMPEGRKTPTSEDIDPEEVAKVVSVSKLRNLFEEKSKEESAGLEVALDAPRTFQYDVAIPYTEGNLGKYRLYRANSGYYLNYSGLLHKTDINKKKADITRSKSLHSFNYDKYVAYKDKNKVTKHSPDDSGDDTDSSSDSIDSVKEFPVKQLSAVQVQVKQEEPLTRTIDLEQEEFQSATISEAQHFHFTRTVATENVQYSSINSTERVGYEELITRTAGEQNEEKLQNATLSHETGTIEDVLISSTDDQPDGNESSKVRPLLNKTNEQEQIEENTPTSPVEEKNETLTTKVESDSEEKEYVSSQDESKENTTINKSITATHETVQSTSKTEVFKVDVEETHSAKHSKTIESRKEVTTVAGYTETTPPTYSTVNEVEDISLSSINTVKTDFSIDDEALITAEEDFDKLLESNEIH